jgi:hydrogenase-4 component B
LGLIASALALLLLLTPVGVAHSRLRHADTLVYFGCLGASAILAVSAFAALVTGEAASTLVLPVGLPWQAVVLRLDPLSAVFLLLVNLASVAASLFGWGYGRSLHAGASHAGEPGRVLALYPLFLFAMNLVLLAADAFSFLFGWELMSVASWLLVLASHREEESQRAARVYLVMAGLGSGALLICFGLLAGVEGGYSFDAMQAAAATGTVAGAVVILATLGAGSKAGLVPLHIWLPLAHPAAPSHVSALMSGAMTKVALYGLVRIVFDLLGTPVWWWGVLLLTLGCLTAVGGVLYALMQDDIKKLLACSTIENIGVILAALGLSLLFLSSGQSAVAALALAAALLHALNHSLFKTLLFLGAGAILSATHRRGLDELGGLIHRMPRTAPLMLLGAAAISALPPLNGFASEWLTFQVVLNGPQLDIWVLKIAVMVAGVLLAFAAALAAACFIRFYGIAFLGQARTSEAASAREVAPPLWLAMTIPALLCVMTGLFPGSVLHLLQGAVQVALGPAVSIPAPAGSWLWLAPAGTGTGFGGNSYSGLLAFGVVAGLAGLVAWVVHRLGSADVRRSDPWGCGYPAVGPQAQYTAGSFAQPLRRIFGSVVFRAGSTVDMPEPGDTRPARLTLTEQDPAWAWLFDPAGRFIDRLADWVNRLQELNIRQYLTLMMVALVTLLLIMVIRP